MQETVDLLTAMDIPKLQRDLITPHPTPAFADGVFLRAQKAITLFNAKIESDAKEIAALREALIKVASHYPGTHGLSFGGNYKLLAESAICVAIEALGLTFPGTSLVAFNADLKAAETAVDEQTAGKP